MKSGLSYWRLSACPIIVRKYGFVFIFKLKKNGEKGGGGGGGAENKKSKCSNGPYMPYLQDFFTVISLT